jgi:hypothetical protein
MPSIPAIQQKTIENKIYSDCIEKLKDVELEDIEIIDGVKYPLLYLFVILIYNHLDIRFHRIFDIAVEYGFMGFTVIFPVLFFYSIWLGFKSKIWFSFWYYLSDELQWDWNLQP